MVEQQKRYVIAGGSGFLGLSLADHLHKSGAEVTILSRSTIDSALPYRHARWDGRTLDDWSTELDGIDGLVNLAGRSVDCRKTPEHRDEILRSRVESTRVLGKAMKTLTSPPPVWVQMGTAHIYGDPPTAVCTEDSAFGHGLAPEVGLKWEQEFHAACLPKQRGVVLRTGFVLGHDRGTGGGAFSSFRFLTRLGLAGRIGKGTQGMSWIHERDMNRLFERALTCDSMTGAYISSGPNPVSQVEFMRQLRRVCGMPIGLPAPGWLVRLGARFLLRTDPELALLGRYVRSDRLADEGFDFEFPELEDALRDLVQNPVG